MEKRFHQLLTKRLAEKGWTKYRLSRELGVSTTHADRMVAGERLPSPELVEKMAAVLGVPVAELQFLADYDRLGHDRAMAIARALRDDVEQEEDEAAGAGE